MANPSPNSADSMPASETAARADIENDAAQKANDADTRHGKAGAEAKPFASSARSHPAHRPGDSETAPDEPNDMISGRRNAGRDDASDAPPRSMERED